MLPLLLLVVVVVVVLRMPRGGWQPLRVLTIGVGRELHRILVSYLDRPAEYLALVARL